MYGDVTIRPYRFEMLPCIDRAELEFFDALAHTFPPEIFTASLVSDALRPLEGYIKTQIAWDWSAQEQFLTLEQLERFCLTPTLLVQIALLPMDTRVILELDPSLVSVMVDRALGGQGDVRNATRTLSDVERGVFAFFLLKSLQQVQTAWGNEHQRELRIAQIATSFEEIQGDLSPDERFYHRGIRLGLIGQVGFLRVYVPASLLREHLTLSSPDEPLSPALIRQRYHRIGNPSLRGSVRIGTVSLSESDLHNLEVDDVVLLENSTAGSHAEGFLEGEATLQFSQRSRVGFRCSIMDEPSSQRSSIRLEEIIPIAEPDVPGVLDRSEYSMDENEQEYAEDYSEEYDELEPIEEDDDNVEQMGPVMSDVPVPLIVEMGRVECRARDLMQLRIGQVMELRRSPYAPLDLVVNGQLLGKGELVEIEGQLGVRIIELLK